MKEINYATLDQAKRMKELGFPQETTDAVWVFIPDSVEKKGKYKNNGWWLIPREDCWWSSESIRKYSKQISVPLTGRVNAPYVTKWYAAPNAQEVELENSRYKSLNSLLISDDYNNPLDGIHFGVIHHAQARCAAWIWEQERK